MREALVLGSSAFLMPPLGAIPEHGRGDIAPTGLSVPAKGFSMSTLIFLDILAYSGAVLGVSFMFLIGAMLVRPGSAAPCLSVLIGVKHAQECVREENFRTSRTRACGSLFLLFATLIAICIVRGFQHL